MATVRCARCGSEEIHAPEWTHANRPEIINGDPYSTSEWWCVGCGENIAVIHDDTTPFDPDACPECGEESEGGAVYVEGLSAHQDRSCPSCDHTWRTIFAFDHHQREDA